MHAEPGPRTLASDPESERDTPMTATYVEVLVLEAVIVAALWIFGRMFA
jgi:hypothetical protein